MRPLRSLRTICEWDVEMYDSDGFIQGHNLAHNYRDALAAAALPNDSLTPRIVLVCDDPKYGRSRAYVVNGVLPTFYGLGRAHYHHSPRALPQASIPERVNRHAVKHSTEPAKSGLFV